MSYNCGFRWLFQENPLSVIANQFEQYHFVLEVIEYDNVFVEYVKQVGSVVTFIATVGDRNVFEIAYGIEGGISVQATVILELTFYIERPDKFVDDVLASVRVVNCVLDRIVVGVSEYCFPMIDSDTGNRV